MLSGVSRKRPRSSISEQSCFSLAELFGSSRQQDENSQNKCKLTPRDSLKESSFDTFRMEQRSGGNLAQHHGEERILIFCSSQRGAIAKIVFSSESIFENSGVSNQQESASAKIHSLSVKEAFRGYGLGRLLFSQSMESLTERYLREPTPRSNIGGLPHVECVLDAEEDVRRHHKLVKFYESCGCHVKPKARISYINNNDGETYRKVPMHIILMAESPLQSPTSRCAWTKFLPVDFFSARHQRAHLAADSPSLDWFVVEIDENKYELRSLNGLLLSVGNDGHCTVVNGRSAPSSQFLFRQTTDTLSSNVNLHCGTHMSCDSGSKDLCTIESCSGRYLGIDPVHAGFTSSENPSFWHVGDCKRSLVCVEDSPARRQHCENLWSIQTLDYVLEKQQRYLRFNLGQLSLKDALDLAGEKKANGFGEEKGDRSLRSLLYTTAEQSRREGFPDWFQLAALIHGIAAVLGLIEPDLTKEMIEEGYDWTLCSQSSFIGPKGTQLKTGERPVLKKSSRVGLRTFIDDSGLSSIVPLWTGPEYLYNMLKHNAVDLPEEAFVVLRLFAMDEPEREEFSQYMAEIVDHEALVIVQDFCGVLEAGRQTAFSSGELDEKACDTMWEAHFFRIFEKYGANKSLLW